MVPRAGIEPARLSAADFKSVTSTDFVIGANFPVSHSLFSPANSCLVRLAFSGNFVLFLCYRPFLFLYKCHASHWTCGSLSAILLYLSLIHISEPTRQAEISYAVFCLKKK